MRTNFICHLVVASWRDVIYAFARSNAFHNKKQQNNEHILLESLEKQWTKYVNQFFTIFTASKVWRNLETVLGITSIFIYYVHILHLLVRVTALMQFISCWCCILYNYVRCCYCYWWTLWDHVLYIFILFVNALCIGDVHWSCKEGDELENRNSIYILSMSTMKHWFLNRCQCLLPEQMPGIELVNAFCMNWMKNGPSLKNINLKHNQQPTVFLSKSDDATFWMNNKFLLSCISTEGCP